MLLLLFSLETAAKKASSPPCAFMEAPQAGRPVCLQIIKEYRADCNIKFPENNCIFQNQKICSPARIFCGIFLIFAIYQGKFAIEFSPESVIILLYNVMTVRRISMMTKQKRYLLSRLSCAALFVCSLPVFSAAPLATAGAETAGENRAL